MKLSLLLPEANNPGKRAWGLVHTWKRGSTITDPILQALCKLWGGVSSGKQSREPESLLEATLGNPAGAGVHAKNVCKTESGTPVPPPKFVLRCLKV